jgi:uncharacterized Tic20 family protein
VPIPVTCPGCKHTDTLPDAYARRQVACTHCQTTIVVASTKTRTPTLKGTPPPAEQEFDVQLVKQPRVKGSSRELAAFCHLIGTAAFLVIPVFVPLVIWLGKRRAPFVATHAKEALNFQINTLFLAVLAVVGRPYLEAWLPQSRGYWLLGVAALLLYSASLSCYAGWVASQSKHFLYPAILRVVR